MTDAERERELDQAHGNAWSFPGAAAPSGTYIGSRRVGNTERPGRRSRGRSGFWCI